MSDEKSVLYVGSNGQKCIYTSRGIHKIRHRMNNDMTKSTNGQWGIHDEESIYKIGYIY